MFINQRTAPALPENQNFRFNVGDRVAHADGHVGEIVHRTQTSRMSGAPGPDLYEVIWIEGPLALTEHLMHGEVLQLARSETAPVRAYAEEALAA